MQQKIYLDENGEPIQPVHSTTTYLNDAGEPVKAPAPAQPSMMSRIMDAVATEGPAIAGGALGGALGAPLGPPGIATGAVFGGAGGESIRQLFNRLAGLPAPETSGEAASKIAEGALSGLGQEVGGIALKQGMKQTAPRMAGILERSSQRNIERILEPTGRDKFVTENIKGELAKRGTVSLTRAQYLAKLEAKTDDAAKVLEDAWTALPEGDKIKSAPIVKALQDVKAQWLVDGQVIEPQAVAKIDEIIEIVQKFGDDVSPQSLRKVRQIWDKTVARVGGFKGKELADSSAVYARQEGASAIRAELGKAYPDIKRLNAEFKFWNSAKEVMEHTVERKSGQMQRGAEFFLAASGATGALAQGAGAAGVAGWAGVMAAIGAAAKSTGWKSMSAYTKSRIAEHIMGGNFVAAMSVLGRVSGGRMAPKFQ